MLRQDFQVYYDSVLKTHFTQDCLSCLRQTHCLSAAQRSGFQGHGIFGDPVDILGSSVLPISTSYSHGGAVRMALTHC